MFLLKPFLKTIESIFIMSSDSYNGKFDLNVIKKISVLLNTRRKYNLNFNIVVCGDINKKYLEICLNAGSDFVVCSSSVSHSNDLQNLVQNLLSK